MENDEKKSVVPVVSVQAAKDYLDDNAVRQQVAVCVLEAKSGGLSGVSDEAIANLLVGNAIASLNVAMLAVAEQLRVGNLLHVDDSPFLSNLASILTDEERVFLPEVAELLGVEAGESE